MCVCVSAVVTVCVVRALVEKICQEMLESAETWSENPFCSVCFISLSLDFRSGCVCTSLWDNDVSMLDTCLKVVTHEGLLMQTEML